jgi:Outer membrane protein beta-barrel domain
MKKSIFSLLVTCLIMAALMLSTAGCRELHEMAEASLDDNHLDHSGPSPYPPALGTPAENIAYLWLEDLTLYLFPWMEDYFDNSYAPSSDFAYSHGPYYQPFGLLPDSNHIAHRHFSVSLSEGLEYVGKGGKESDNGTITITKLNYLEVPVLINYNYTLPEGKETLHAGIGPYVAMAISGKFKSNNGQTTAVKFGNSGDFNRMDDGLQFKAGCLFVKKWDVSLGYDWGLKNLLALPGGANDGDKGKIRSLSLNLGYQFK